MTKTIMFVFLAISLIGCGKNKVMSDEEVAAKIKKCEDLGLTFEAHNEYRTNGFSVEIFGVREITCIPKY